MFMGNTDYSKAYMSDYGEPRGRTAYAKAHAKINLTLEVGRARGDGYHTVSMIMQSLRLWDDVEIELLKDGENRVECNIPFLKAETRNLAYRAVLLMQERFGLKQPVFMQIRKKIPIASGLAGGSADAAAALRAMNKLFSLRLSTEELMKIGAEIGSDVPFCLLGGTALATGRGEIVTPLRAFPMTCVILVKPDFSVSTPWAYQQFDLEGPQPAPDVDRFLKAVESRRIESLQPEMINMLERPVSREHPEIPEIKGRLLALGADAASMSGSGPTVYGLFRDGDAARAALMELRHVYPRRYTILMTNTENPRYQQRDPWLAPDTGA